MQRRRFLQLGLVSAAILAVGGGAVALRSPGLQDGRLTDAGQHVMRHAGRAILDGSLPAGAAQTQALDGLLARVDALAANLPPHAQGELSQLLALLAGSAGRRALAGLAPDWAEASVAQLQAALQAMRTSSLGLRRQAYQALHDIALGAYFSDASTWAVMGYPGPVRLA